MEGLGQQFNNLLRKAADANNADSYTAQFQSISTAMAEFKRRKAKILQIRQEQEQTNRRVQAVASVLKTASSELTEWDDSPVERLFYNCVVNVLRKEEKWIAANRWSGSVRKVEECFRCFLLIDCGSSA